MTIDQQIALWRAEHEQRQFNVAHDQIAIRDGVVIKSGDQHCRFCYEFFCWRSPESRAEMTAFIDAIRMKKVFMDIGAAQGVFSSVFCAVTGGRAFAFEPNQSARAVMVPNVLGGGFTCEVHPFAMSDRVGEIECHAEEGLFVAGGDGLLSANQVPKESMFRIFCSTIDAFCSERKLVPDTIKIDVEGHEASVIRGGAETIRKHRPLIFLEAHLSFIRRSGTLDDFRESLGILDGYTATNSFTGVVCPVASIADHEEGNPHFTLQPE